MTSAALDWWTRQSARNKYWRRNPPSHHDRKKDIARLCRSALFKVAPENCSWGCWCAPCVCVCSVCFYACFHGCLGEISPPGSVASPQLRAAELETLKPPPLPEMRPGNLTPPLSPHEMTQQVRQSSTVAPIVRSRRRKAPGPESGQLQSPLFRLPVEVRNHIWRFVLAGNVIHIGWGPGRLHHTLCYRCQYPISKTHSRICCPYSIKPEMERISPAYIKARVRPSPHLLGLSKTCHKIYRETIDMVYADNVFSFNYNGCLEWFCQTIPLQRLSQVRTVWFVRFISSSSDIVSRNPHVPPVDATAEKICHLLNGMEGLEEFCYNVVFNRDSRVVEPRVQSAALEPFVRQVKPLRVFRIRGPFRSQQSRVATTTTTPFQLYDMSGERLVYDPVLEF
ncbi:hypothetical protein HJFPF1_13014 [Paramyrothecium foliicola]|nr:hypothetical protein HJFPF1_13014 [Paramyrothecium foliicola]